MAIEDAPGMVTDVVVDVPSDIVVVVDDSAVVVVLELVVVVDGAVVVVIELVVVDDGRVVVVVGSDGGGGNGGRSIFPRSGKASWEHSSGSPVRLSTKLQ